MDPPRSMSRAWPKELSYWMRLNDLLLASQLAALQNGFAGVVAEPHDDMVTIRCLQEHDSTQGCTTRLLTAEKDPSRIATGYRVKQVFEGCRDLALHENHKPVMFGGISAPLRKRLPDKMLRLQPGDVVETGRMHTLEASLRVLCRRKGYYLSTCFRSTGGQRHFSLHCEHGAVSCKFRVRFALVTETPDGDHAWKCVEIGKRHTCQSHGHESYKGLRQRMNFWPDLRLTNGSVELNDAPTANASTSRSPSPIPSDDCNSPADSSPPTSSTNLGATEADLLPLRTKVADLQEAVNKLDEELGEARRALKEKEKALEKRRVKMQKMVEKRAKELQQRTRPKRRKGRKGAGN